MTQGKPYALKVENLSKTFSSKNRYPTFRERLTKLFAPQKEGEHKALTDINFTVKKNEFFGIIGSNGSGKSTLLKLIIGAYKADIGSKIDIDGKIIRLALGIGFDPNLSARDNIYVNGAIIGMSFKEVGTKFHDIIAFGELEKFVDTPLKYYSSGMRSKLAFSIAMHVDTDILLIDEFFGGVGDISFKQKSTDAFTNRIINNKTVIFISHNLNLIQDQCDRVCLIDKGQQIALGTPDKVIPIYKEKYRNG